eukprot:scaffold69116_cov74-Phaeocystis_antarctica.AAC.1
MLCLFIRAFPTHWRAARSSTVPRGPVVAVPPVHRPPCGGRQVGEEQRPVERLGPAERLQRGLQRAPRLPARALVPPLRPAPASKMRGVPAAHDAAFGQGKGKHICAIDRKRPENVFARSGRTTWLRRSCRSCAGDLSRTPGSKDCSSHAPPMPPCPPMRTSEKVGTALIMSTVPGEFMRSER